MVHLVSVEYNWETKHYEALFSDDHVVQLEATTLRNAEEEAAMIAEQDEFVNFVSRRDWE